ncbi:MAG: hypothetical protein LBH05_04265 [Deferribacteraceae bacterium]|jgi:hypothetical protein|nr:hypothetical protein [Deferribacteraceae bacterium]
MKKITFLIFLLLFAKELLAEDRREIGEGVTASHEFFLLASSLPEIKLAFTERLIFPFLQGEGFLTRDNNINLAFGAEISPVSLNGIVNTVWTPVAFFQLMAGGRIGSGWNIELYDSEFYGIGLNQPDDAGKSSVNGGGFDGLLWEVHTGAVLQTDLSALYPGDWHHVVFRSYHELNYKGYTRAAKGESWFFENDDGENCNGFNYYGNMLVGFQMPVFFNLAAILAEADLYLYDTPQRDKWGDNKIRWTFSGIFGFYAGKMIDLKLIAQCVTQRNYQESNWQDLYYRNRNIDKSNPLRLEFYRIVAALTYKFN